MVKIIKCDYENKYQDKVFGKNNRVANQTKKSEGKIYRCTVCNKEK